MIRRQVRVSRAELAKQTAIRPPTVSAVVKELIDEGLVKEVGTGATSGGRAPRMVSLNDCRPLALGFELSETSIHAGLCSRLFRAPRLGDDVGYHHYPAGFQIADDTSIHR